MRLYLSEILAVVGWGVWASHLYRCRKNRRTQERWWRDYQQQMNKRWASYSTERLEGRNEN